MLQMLQRLQQTTRQLQMQPRRQVHSLIGSAWPGFVAADRGMPMAHSTRMHAMPQVHACMHTCAHTCLRTRMCARPVFVHAHTHACTHTCMHACTCALTHQCAHTGCRCAGARKVGSQHEVADAECGGEAPAGNLLPSDSVGIPNIVVALGGNVITEALSTKTGS